jgi:hypothetical protein
MKAVKIFEIDLEKYPHASFFGFVDKYVKMAKGEYILINIKNDGNSAIISCPKCGAKRPLAKKIGKKGHLLKFNENAELTITPSLNNDNGGCCNYHGFLKNDVFTNV